MRHLSTDDGRRLAWYEFGAPEGHPVFALHGLAASHRQFGIAGDAIGQAGVRLLALDRPGYGHSSFHAGRRLSDHGADLARIADRVGIGTYSVLGVSAGGPAALGAAATDPDRIERVVTLSSVGPCQRPGRHRMLPVAGAMFALGRRRSPVLPTGLTAVIGLARRRPQLSVSCRQRMLPEVDRAVMARPDVRSLYEAEARHASRTTGRAAAQDIRLLAGTWDFDASDVTVPVDMIHGMDDGEAPLAQARELAQRLPDVRLHVVPGGHLTFVDHLADAMQLAGRTAVS